MKVLIKEGILELLTIPPGFVRGIIFDSDGCTVKCYTDEVEDLSLKILPDLSENVVNLQSLIQQEQNSLGKYSNVYCL